MDDAGSAMIEFQQVGKSFGGQAVVEDFSLTIAPGEFVVLIGRSGSGKSTTLKMVNRLVEHNRGRILFAGQEIRSFQPEDLRRRMGYAIQSTGLFPHWTVERNIACVPTLLKWPAARIRDRVTELLELLQLSPELYRGRYPNELSGGQQQRIGVARALAADPDVLLMDEPFGALDPITRAVLQTELARIHQLSGKTIVLVTHDIDEALRLGSRIVLLDHGRIVQIGPPRQLLAEPANDFVREFIGRSDTGLRLLALETVASRMRRESAKSDAPASLRDTDSLRDALSMLLAQGVSCLPVVDGAGQLCGQLHLADLVPSGS
jgi:osmoprotectant transport system ATP-binding protein